MPEATGNHRVTRIAAYGLLVDGERIVLCRLSPQLPELAGSWTLPGGGLEFGEHPADAMVREVREETGLIVRPAGVADVDAIAGRRAGLEFHSIRIVYFADIMGGTLSNEVDGTTDRCAWHSRVELGHLPLVDLALLGQRLAFGGATLADGEGSP